LTWNHSSAPDSDPAFCKPLTFFLYVTFFPGLVLLPVFSRPLIRNNHSPSFSCLSSPPNQSPLSSVQRHQTSNFQSIMWFFSLIHKVHPPPPPPLFEPCFTDTLLLRLSPRKHFSFFARVSSFFRFMFRIVSRFDYGATVHFSRYLSFFCCPVPF